MFTLILLEVRICCKEESSITGETWFAHGVSIMISKISISEMSIFIPLGIEKQAYLSLPPQSKKTPTTKQPTTNKSLPNKHTPNNST